MQSVYKIELNRTNDLDNIIGENIPEEETHLREKLLLPKNVKDKKDFINQFCQEIEKVDFFFNENYNYNIIRFEKIKVLSI